MSPGVQKCPPLRTIDFSHFGVWFYLCKWLITLLHYSDPFTCCLLPLCIEDSPAEILISCFSECNLRTSSNESTREMLEMQTLRPHPRTTDLEYAFLTKFPSDSSAHYSLISNNHGSGLQIPLLSVEQIGLEESTQMIPYKLIHIGSFPFSDTRRHTGTGFLLTSLWASCGYPVLWFDMWNSCHVSLIPSTLHSQSSFTPP